MKISILGASGSVGKLVVEEADSLGISVVGSVSEGESVGDLFGLADVVIDFSAPLAVAEMLSFVEKSSSCTPLVIGTTGLSDEHFKNMSRISRMCPIFYSPNMSYAVAVMNLLIRISSCLLDESFDAEILDVHHRQKKDAPSGTSIMFGKTIAESRNRNLQDVANFSRLNSRGARELGEIGFSSQRCGNVAGMHEVSFSDLAERIKITHEAYSKAVFAKGAIGAARWLLSRSPAFYTMNDMLREKIGPELSSLLSKCGSGNV